MVKHMDHDDWSYCDHNHYFLTIISIVEIIFIIIIIFVVNLCVLLPVTLAIDKCSTVSLKVEGSAT